MASMTASSVAARVAVRSSSFVSGSSKVSAVAMPVCSKATRGARFVVRAADEDAPVAAAPAAPKAIVKKERSRDSVYLMGVSDQNMAYLDGTLPGDFGFDPLGMLDPEGQGGFINPAWLSYAEVIHGRWAMLGIAGLVAPEILGGAGIIPADTGLVWFRSGAIPPQGTFDYWADPTTIFWVNMVMMNFAEVKRGQDYWHPGSQGKQSLMGWESGFGGSGNPAYPGGKWFNFANLAQPGSSSEKDLRQKEIKNGRLAMMAFLGCTIQAGVTGVGPWQNICDHVADPFGANMLVNFGNIGGASPF
eukprot:CAMPEP_0197581920 /NCGR_PEP_ID=MMETSP1326-20131121/5278_1 /TAXON_ID=1155430 /ORGANISM="Genus nov. species nov., Strain RCC2288" /LENGTH=302 /DNA_ID=CAMNT_0043145899 /DNA_START=25 /DNA_END=933 /DNA_ORIENTATION=-